MTKQELFLKAIELSAESFQAYVNLADTLPAGGSIQLTKDKIITKQELNLQAFKLIPKIPAMNPHLAWVLTQLALTLSDDETIDLPNNPKMANKDLYRYAIEFDPNRFDTYYGLGKTLQTGETIVINGQEMTKLDIKLKVVELAPDWSEGYLSLGNALEKGEEVDLHGKPMTKQSCYIMAIHLRPGDSRAYWNLHTTLLGGGSARLLDGRTLTARDLVIEVNKLDPEDQKAKNYLQRTLRLDEEFKLADGTILKGKDPMANFFQDTVMYAVGTSFAADAKDTSSRS